MIVDIEKKSKLTFHSPANKKDTLTVVLNQPSIYNKSKQHVRFVNDILETKENKQWYFNIMKKVNLTQDMDVIYNEVLDKIIKIAQKYTDKMSDVINFSSFVNRSKKTSNSILFDETDIEKIYTLSGIVKLFAVFSSSTLVGRQQDKMNKYAFDYLIKKAGMKKVTDEIHNLVYTKLFRCVGLDPTVLKTMQMKALISDDDYVLYLFDYVISAILAIYDMVRNPVTFIVTSADQVMSWRIQALYNKAIVYKETGELFGKSMSTMNLPEKIICNKIYEYVEDYVSVKNKERNIIIDDYNTSLDRYFHNFFVIPLFTKLFNLKSFEGEYNEFQKINIQLFLYYTLKDFMDKTDTNIFPMVTDEKFIKTKENFEKYKLLEILKRLPLTSVKKFEVLQSSIFLSEDYLIDDTRQGHKNKIGFQYSSMYRLECISELLTSKFKFYGVNNMMILNNYLKTIMNVLVSLSFKNIFIFDLTKENFSAKKYSKQVELELMPFLMVILDNEVEFFEKYKKYVSSIYCDARTA